MGVIRREQAGAAPLFSFRDVEREAAEIIAAGRRHAEALVAAAHQKVREAEQRVEDIEEAHRKEGYEDGFAEGQRIGIEQAKREAREASLAAAQAEVSQLTQALSAGLHDYDAKKHTIIAQAESGLISLAVAIARRVCKSLAEQSIAPAIANAGALLELVRHHADVELHFHPREYELMEEVATELPNEVARLRHITIKPDPTVPRGGCRLHAPHGTIDAAIEAQVDRIAQVICGVLSHTSGTDAARTRG